MNWRASSFAGLAIGLIAAAAPSQAYYHFIHYLNGGNAPEKFDLTALPGKTVTFFVSETGPTTYAPNDSFNSVLSQIQQATLVWNGIASSDLRVSFGGLEATATPQITPGGDVSFEDLPPGVEGYGGPTTLATPVTAPDGSQFFPIVRSVVHLSLNLNQPPGPSYDQTFLMTTIHEIGHALGLQHTFTSASMSQATTSATTLTHPVGADDVAGISVLYPNANFAQFGSIAGKITAGGKPVHLASVVAIQNGADAVSAVTNPDGTFQMSGVPPGQYLVYVHTMPPDADIFGPWNADGSVAAASGAINSLFYPGTKDFTQATTVTVTAGTVASGINIQSVNRASVPLYDGQVYGYFNNNTIEVYPAPVAISPTQTPVVASIVGLGSNEPESGLSVQVPGGAVSIASNGIVPIVSGGYTYAAVFLNLNAGAQPGPQHMIFNTPDYMYVLPSAMYLTPTGPPTVTTVTNNGDGTATVAGTNWTAGTLLYFDGFPATITSLNAAAGTAVVTPPPGASGQTSSLTAYNPDGQNSQILQSAAPVTYSYGNLAPPAITSIAPASLPAGAEAMIDIQGSGFNFIPGLTTIGFGTTDVAVQRVFVLSPNHVQVNVRVASNAALSTSDVTAISGFELAMAPSAFQITAQVTGLPTVSPTLVNGVPGQSGSYAGAVVSLYGANLSAPAFSPSITFGGVPATILYISPSQINLQIPASLPPGPVTMTVTNGIATGFPVVVNIDPPPAEIVAVQNASGAYVIPANPAHQGDVLIVTLIKFAAAGATINPNRVQVSIGGVSHNALQIGQAVSGSLVYSQVSFQLTANDPIGPTEPLIVYLDGRSSLQAAIPVVAAAGN
jgi:uncharacterized protein (TIGR03437 family)